MLDIFPYKKAQLFLKLIIVAADYQRIGLPNICSYCVSSVALVTPNCFVLICNLCTVLRAFYYWPGHSHRGPLFPLALYYETMIHRRAPL